MTYKVLLCVYMRTPPLPPPLPFRIFLLANQVVKVQMQAKENLGRYTGVINCASSLVQTEGPFALYKGLESHLWRNAVWNGELRGGGCSSEGLAQDTITRPFVLEHICLAITRCRLPFLRLQLEGVAAVKV